MRQIILVIAVIGLLAAPGLLFSQADENGQWTEVQMKFKEFKKDAPVLTGNRESAKNLSAAIAFENKKGSSFTVEVGPGSVRIDLTGGNNLTTKISLKGEIVKLKDVKFKDGSFNDYAVRIFSKGKTWFYERAGGMFGTIDGCEFGIIDENTNGVYNDKGIDAVVYAKGGKWATPIGDVININNKLYYYRANESGSVVKLQEFKGKAGEIDLASDYKIKGNLNGLVIKGDKGCFDATKGKISVPEGNYTILWGGVEKGKQDCRIENGSMEPVKVEEGKLSKKTLGDNFEIVFTIDKNGSKITINANMYIKGGAGETYTDFGPNPITPQIFIKEDKNKKLLDKGKFCLG